MMKYPDVINRDTFEMEKLALARKYNKPADGHAPGLTGEKAKKYIEAGISTDHECFTMEEALDKIKYGMKIQIREGSAARNFDALIGLMKDYPEYVLFCSDDKHPDELVEGHINKMIIRAIRKGFDPLQVLQSVILNPIRHYNLDVGTLRPGEPADMIVVDTLKDFNVLQTYINGERVAENGKSRIHPVKVEMPNIFNAKKLRVEQLALQPAGEKMKVITAFNGELITGTEHVTPKVSGGHAISDPNRDILKIVVLNRYQESKPAIAFIRNFGLKTGAIASSVAHDSHNIVAVGVEDEHITKAINLIIEQKGGISFASDRNSGILPLPVAGLMSADDGYRVAHQYKRMDEEAKALGSTLEAPFMTLSFMALLVIPELKLSDKGLFDGKTFSFTPLFI
ncbi:MAG: adenine deaminase C-terminal domain-containing protein [bacterium]